MDCGSITSLRTGAAAAVSAQVLAADGARSVGIIGCGVNGAWAARCLAAAGYGPGVCADLRPEARRAACRGARLGGRRRAEAAAQDVVVTVTPGDEPVILASDLRPGQHLAVLGADAAGKAEVELAALERCRLFCDEWEQAARRRRAGRRGGGRARSSRDDVTQLGDVIAGRAEGRRSDEEITLFDSTGLAIQDLGIATAVYEAWREGRGRGGRGQPLAWALIERSRPQTVTGTLEATITCHGSLSPSAGSRSLPKCARSGRSSCAEGGEANRPTRIAVLLISGADSSRPSLGGASSRARDRRGRLSA